MNELELDKLFISTIPEFRLYWDKEDIFREDDGSFTPHGVMGSFYYFFQENHQSLSKEKLNLSLI